VLSYVLFDCVVLCIVMCVNVYYCHRVSTQLQLNISYHIKYRRMRWAGHVARMGEERSVHRVLVGKTEEKRPLGKPRRRWEDDIKMDLQEVGGGRGD
jgi:hypothetical protein